MNILFLTIYVNKKKLNLIRTWCKPFGLHQTIKTCHIRFLLKLIAKSIHPNIPNIISTNKQKLDFTYSLNSYVSSHNPHRTSVCCRNTSPDLRVNQKRYCKFNTKNTLSKSSCHKNLSVRHFDKHLVSTFKVFTSYKFSLFPITILTSTWLLMLSLLM